MKGSTSDTMGQGSIKTFSEDAEFIQFLKNISLYVTSQESPRDTESSQSDSGNSVLYKNLQYLRERFKE